MNNVKENTQVKTTSVACPSVEERLSQTTMGLVFGAGSLVSLWSIASLVGAFVTTGTAGFARGLVTAVTGV